MADKCRGLVLGLLGLLVLHAGSEDAGADEALARATALLDAGRPGEALVLLHDVEQQLPDPRVVWPLLGTGYLQAGWQQMNRGQDEAAREAFFTARHYLPDDPRPLQATALSWLHAGQPAAALAPLQEALALAPADPESFLLLGRAYHALGELEDAKLAWTEALRSGAGSAGPLLEKLQREILAEHEMTRSLGGRFTLAYAPEVNPALADEVLDVLQAAYHDLGRELGYYPEGDIPVLLYAHEDFAAVTRSPAWAGAVYDGKIRVPLGGVAQMSPPLRELLRHEYAHALVRFVGKGRVPVWLNEGIAQLAEGREETLIDKPAGKELLTAASLERPFTELSDELVPIAYAESRARVKCMTDLCGWPALGELLRQLGNGLSWEEAVAEAYTPCGYDWPRLEAELARPAAD